MTKSQFNLKTSTDLTATENALINFNIYHNEDHVEYHQNYQMGNYQWCYEYLISNRHLLTIEHTPEDQRDIAEMSIEIAKEFYEG